MTAGWGAALALAGLLVLAGCAPASEPVAIAGDHDGLEIRAEIRATQDSIVVDAVLRNAREDAIVVVPDQCGRVLDVELERSVLRPEGAAWQGSVQAAKKLVLDDQLSRQRPDSFHPRRVGDSPSDVPACTRPERPIRIDPDSEIAERWELPFAMAYGLQEVGSKAATISLEALEAGDPAEPEFLDILPDEAEDQNRRGRVVRAELPLSTVANREASRPATGPSMGELFDRLLADAELKAWIEAQPEDGWRHATLTPAAPDFGQPVLRLRLVNIAFERAALVEAQPDGSAPTLDLPGEEFRTREFRRSAGTLPPGIALIPEPHYSLTDDLHVGEVVLPSGRLFVGEYLFDEEELDVAVAPGAYPVHATLARYGDQDLDSVSFASIVFSDRPTVRWDNAGAIAVDGGSTSIVSVEGRDAMAAVMDEDEDRWLELQDQIFESKAAHEYLATEFDITPELNLASFSSGVGDGGYPVYVGFDTEGKPTRVVVDFYLLHLAWPDA